MQNVFFGSCYFNLNFTLRVYDQEFSKIFFKDVITRYSQPQDFKGCKLIKVQ